MSERGHYLLGTDIGTTLTKTIPVDLEGREIATASVEYDFLRPHVLCANEEDRVAEQAAEWKTQAEEITCHGCKSDVLSGYCRSCEIKACAVEKGLEFCVDCAEYPCDRLIAFRDDEWPHHSVVTRNSEELGRIGLERWLEAQAQRWRCSACGQRTSWYDETCSACGVNVVSSRDEEKQTVESQPQGGG